ncbi:MAG TPA: metallophosphoesterase [Longimicrobium sp.]|nr:metallophosphoesterase [Longimicrobium sp.]
MRGRIATAALAGVAALTLSGCFQYVRGLGRVIPGLMETDTLELNLVLIGDAGLPAPGGEPVLRALRDQLTKQSKTTFVVFLGDNVYPRGMVRDSSAAERRENERILNAQMDVLLETGTRGVLVPGNHDWDAGGAAGLEVIRAQERYVNRRGGDLVKVLPSNGCPGPVPLDFGSYLRVLVLDTQWWLQAPHPRPYGERAEGCRARTEEEVVDSIHADLANAGRRRTVVVAHHPLVSGGQHGGYFDWPTYLFPLHPWARWSGAGAFAKQDVTGTQYRVLRESLARAFARNPPLVYAAGHEHNLQVLRHPPARYLVVSGAGIYNHTTQSRAIAGTMYARRASGWTEMAFLRDGRVRISVKVVDAQGQAKEDFSTWLDTPPLVPEADANPTTPHTPVAPSTPVPGSTSAPPPAPTPPPAPEPAPAPAPPSSPTPTPTPAPPPAPVPAPPPPPPTAPGAPR